jgi:hypothetical protein
VSESKDEKKDAQPPETEVGITAAVEAATGALELELDGSPP